MLKLAVLNECIALMGQAPLTSISDNHPLRAVALSTLDAKNKNVQQPGYWFNTETITLSPDITGKVILPGDCLRVLAPIGVSKRGPILYDNKNSTDLFTSSVELEIVRLLDFETLEEPVAEYVCALTIAWFQLQYDGDSTKQTQCNRRVEAARISLNAEQTRQGRANRIDSNPTLSYLRSIRHTNRYPIR
jgi:Tail tubular protein